ncbi:hypothetical protein LZ24_00174 [Desulfobotulus alkaliphilus]|uniref:Phospholipase/lecithinase/hemolysin n=1 Tax=Desulfobotulus alkaliphilus TaxID=622671 RepID=A0A562S7G8_9BACT|nr:SGNH/GDSL hydrolase family protein [Desulfobotulus alkaliphilus]TWI77365.1 hypothetical protein LZ24_00174 [Desulfobotulus alkaliphilus]
MLKFSRKNLLIIGLAALFLCAMASGAWAKTYSNILVFGDSLSDVNNMHTITQGQQPVRYSDDKVWIEFLAEKMGLEDKLINKAYGGAKTTGHLNEQFNNFGFQEQINAYTSKNTIDPNALVAIWIGGNDLNTHLPIISYNTAQDASNPANNGPWVKEAIAAIQKQWIESGKDPSELPAYLGSDEGKAKIAEMVNGKIQIYLRDEIVLNIVHGIQALERSGAKNFLILNIPDLGKTPQAIETARIAASGAIAQADQADQVMSPEQVAGIIKETLGNISKLTAAFNDVTMIALQNLFSSLGPNAKYQYYSAFKFMNQAIAQADETSFPMNKNEKYSPEKIAEQLFESKTTNFGELKIWEIIIGAATNKLPSNFYNDYQTSWLKLEGNVEPPALPVIKAQSPATPNTGVAADYIFFDTIHPTSKAHKELAKDVLARMQASKLPAPPEAVKVDSEIAGSPCFIDSAAAANHNTFMIFMGLMAGLGMLMIIIRKNHNRG